MHFEVNSKDWISCLWQNEWDDISYRQSSYSDAKHIPLKYHGVVSDNQTGAKVPYPRGEIQCDSAKSHCFLSVGTRLTQ